MTKPQFLFFLLPITLLGLWLRLINYDTIPPFGETKDEFIYPWAGITLLQTGTPSTWSDFVSYRDAHSVTLFATNFRIIKPWLDKPPLYALLTGMTELSFGHDEFHEVRLTTLRLVPLVLGTLSILFLGLFTRELFSDKIALLASLVFATTPTIVLGNRLSVTENLLIPLTLCALWLYEKTTIHIIIISLICVAAILTKQIGLVLPITLLILFGSNRRWKEVLIIAVSSTFALLIHPLMGLFYDWQLYTNVMQELRLAHALGLPEAITTLFRFPGIGHKESIFLDGAMLTGWILLFSSPFWIRLRVTRVKPEMAKWMKFSQFAGRCGRGLRKQLEQYPDRVAEQENFVHEQKATIIFPFVYLTLLVLGQGGTTWYGWHLFPLYPFIAILLAWTMYRLYKEASFLQFLFFFIILGSSSLRFLLLAIDNVTYAWQPLLIASLLVITSLWSVGNEVTKRVLLISLFALYVGINIYTVVHLDNLYPSQVQPLTTVSNNE